MTEKQFNGLARECFGAVLIPAGFANEGSVAATFYRAAPDDVFHFVLPEMGRSGTWYDIHVFPQSPHIEPRFTQRFPDDLGFPTDMFSFLSENDGVGSTQEQFSCRTEEHFRRSFEKRVRRLLLEVAVPYLTRFQSVADIIPVIQHPYFLGFALHYVGRRAEARVALEEERATLARLDPTNEEVALVLARLEKLLSESAT